jgi:hypothetical protein
MAISKVISAELTHRIDADVVHFGGTLPERTAIAWRAYLAAMLEWDVIPVADYDALVARIPPVDDDPAVAILRGRG